MSAEALTASDLFDAGPSVRLKCEFGHRRLQWGHEWQWASASYWTERARRLQVEPGHFRLGADLMEEVAVCILGGYGMPAAVGLAAFDAIRDANLIRPFMDARDVEAVLQKPLRVGDRSVRYRFPRQRSARLAAALTHIHEHPLPRGARDLRNALTKAPGVGFKTASWVVRNQLDSDEVAIVDIHLCRAGEAAGVFHRGWKLPRDYQLYEAFFLAWAAHGRVRPSVLDACIWDELAQVGSTSLPSRH